MVTADLKLWVLKNIVLQYLEIVEEVYWCSGQVKIQIRILRALKLCAPTSLRGTTKTNPF